jgi:hypothetical protein
MKHLSQWGAFLMFSQHDKYKRMLTNLSQRAVTTSTIRPIFECIAFAKRPLTLDELVTVVELDFDSNTWQPESLNRDDVAALEDMLHRMCAGFVHVVDDHDSTTGSALRVVRFVHEFVKDYLEKPDLPQSVNDPISKLCLQATSAHTTLSQMCLSTLTRVVSPSPPFRPYSVCHWDEHVSTLNVSHDSAKADPLSALLHRFLHPHYFHDYQRDRVQIRQDGDADMLKYWRHHFGLGMPDKDVARVKTLRV